MCARPHNNRGRPKLRRSCTVDQESTCGPARPLAPLSPPGPCGPRDVPCGPHPPQTRWWLQWAKRIRGIGRSLGLSPINSSAVVRAGTGHAVTVGAHQSGCGRPGPLPAPARRRRALPGTAVPAEVLTLVLTFAQLGAQLAGIVAAWHHRGWEHLSGRKWCGGDRTDCALPDVQQASPAGQRAMGGRIGKAHSHSPE